jgi:hypothetical protein
MANHLTVSTLLERNKYEFPVEPLTSSTLTMIRAVAAHHQPIPTFAELAAMNVDKPRILIRKYWSCLEKDLHRSKTMNSHVYRPASSSRILSESAT